MFKDDGLINKEGTAYTALKGMADTHFNGASVHPAQTIEGALDEAIYTFLDRTHLSTVKPIHYPVIIKLSEYLINVRGTVGTTSEKLADVSTSYTEDIPKEILHRIYKYRVLPKPKDTFLW